MHQSLKRLIGESILYTSRVRDQAVLTHETLACPYGLTIFTFIHELPPCDFTFSNAIETREMYLSQLR